MPEFGPELIAAARAMYADSQPLQAYYGRRAWDQLDPADHEDICQAFAAGLDTLLPVSAQAGMALLKVDKEQQGLVGYVEVYINHITGRDA